MSKDDLKRIDEKTLVPFSWLVISVVFACGGAWGTFSLIYSMTSKIDATQKEMRYLKANVRKIMAKENIKPVEESDDLQSSSGILNDAEARSTK